MEVSVGQLDSYFNKLSYTNKVICMVYFKFANPFKLSDIIVPPCITVPKGKI